MARHALQQRQRITYAVGGVRGQRRRRQQRVDSYDLLQQRAHCAEAVPQVRRQLREGLALLAELQQRVLPRLPQAAASTAPSTLLIPMARPGQHKLGLSQRVSYVPVPPALIRICTRCWAPRVPATSAHARAPSLMCIPRLQADALLPRDITSSV